MGEHIGGRVTADLSNGTIVVLAVLALIAFLCVLGLARVMLRRDIGWRRFRVGVFFERDQNDGAP